MCNAVVVADFGSGNLGSLVKCLGRLGSEVKVSSDARQIAGARKIILPGVGHFGAAMARLHNLDLVSSLNEAALGRGVPVLGICLGMQLMASWSDEGKSPGLGWFKAEVVRLEVSDTARFKVPHTGWNGLQSLQQHPLLKEIGSQDEFYFLHSYGWRTSEPHQVLASTNHGGEFASVVASANLMGVQFHPEKSHQSGRQLLRNFLDL